MIITATVTIQAPQGDAEDFYRQMNDYFDQLTADYGQDGFIVQVQRGIDLFEGGAGMSERTDHGFKTGAIEAIAMYEVKGYGCVLLRIGDAEVEVVATPKGRKARVWLRDGDKSGIDYQGHVLWSSE